MTFVRSLDMLLINEHGDQIHVVVPKEVIHQFAEQLREGELIHVEKFNVSTNNATYRPVVEGKLKIYFSINTVVKKSENQGVPIPMHKFSFVDFSDIPTRCHKPKYLTGNYKYNMFLYCIFVPLTPGACISHVRDASR
ncbi:hypothetical protein GIB67_039487 [Kingdonia uniflora]|uniref:Replication protein A 70 kDa DNA-binding subunit B/D first OB fold domain-containing protein n=1 Tax=Kingdonia uniflora TaxID=39325 RepID=A0A7J7LIQ9_9MAGN|nr:hypothetical protein GIB67_039487 [Kingdonia uniflora]